jgi:two-component system LytT family response regulator
MDLTPNKFIETRINNSSRMAIKAVEGIKISDCDQIIYCKADGNYTSIHFTWGNILVTKTLKQIETSLPKNYFIRIHKSYLVNISTIITIKCDSIILGSDIELPLARRRRPGVVKSLTTNIIYL